MASKTFCDSCFSFSSINPAACAKIIHSSIWSTLPQYKSHDFLLPQEGGFTPCFIAALTFLASSNSFGGNMLFFSANVTHSSIWEISSQYFSQESFVAQFPGPLPAAKNFLATLIFSWLIKLFFWAKSKHFSLFAGLSQ